MPKIVSSLYLSKYSIKMLYHMQDIMSSVYLWLLIGPPWDDTRLIDNAQNPMNINEKMCNKMWLWFLSGVLALILVL